MRTSLSSIIILSVRRLKYIISYLYFTRIYRDFKKHISKYARTQFANFLSVQSSYIIFISQRDFTTPAVSGVKKRNNFYLISDEHLTHPRLIVHPCLAGSFKNYPSAGSFCLTRVRARPVGFTDCSRYVQTERDALNDLSRRAKQM